MKRLIILATAACLIFSLSACGKKEDVAAAKASGATGAAASGEASGDLKLVATNFKFDQAEYKVKKGQEVKISLENKEGMHGIEIKGLNVKLDGKNKTGSFKADKAGTYEIVCSVPCGQGHITMKSKLVVEA